MDEADIGRRTAERFWLDFPAELIFADCAVNVSLRDLSCLGARISTSTALRRGMRTALKWGGYQVGATVVWTATRQAGLSFHGRIPDQTLVRMRLLATPHPWKDANEAIRLAAEKIMQDVHAI